jgi:hypothetical protein
MGKKIRSGSRIRIRDKHAGSNFRELRNNGLKTLKFFEVDPDPGTEIFMTLDPGYGMEKFGSGIQDNHPGSPPLHLAFKLNLISQRTA